MWVTLSQIKLPYWGSKATCFYCFMIKIRNDFNGFADRYSNYLGKQELEIEIEIVDINNPKAQTCDINNTPFACNPIIRNNGVYIIVFNQEIIDKLELTCLESDACLLHEIGHFINNGNAEGINLEILCDKVAVEVNLSSSMLSAMYKMQNQLGINLQERIDALCSSWRIYRPEWTCGRYNDTKRVAIMYNLITGFSFYFDDFSAIVVGEILKARKNGGIDIRDIETATGICIESLSSFFHSLLQYGLLANAIPTKEEIHNYRLSVSEAKKANQSWVDKSTKEKLPMEVTNAEQAYFSAVEDGKTICSCMFELTYRCSEMCIHCYNPGATRNNTETSHRADHIELALDDYKRIIDDMYDNGLVKVCLSGGDPFSKDFVWDLIDYLYNKGVAVDVYTNGQRIVEEVIRLAGYYPRLVGVSLYSGIAEDHDTITRMPGSWERSMLVIKQLSELAIPMNLKCCVMQPNLHSYYMVADIAKQYGAIPQYEINITESNDGDICAKQLRLTEEQLQVVLRDNNLALYVGKEAPNYGGKKRDPSSCSCGAGGTGFCMSPNGDLRACVAFTQIYGNLAEQSISEIFSKSTVLKEWRSAVIADYTECGRYDYCDYCNLCAGVNYTEHKDFHKPAETNCYMAKCRFNLAKKLMVEDDPLTRKQLIERLQSLTITKTVLKRLYKNG